MSDVSHEQIMAAIGKLQGTVAAMGRQVEDIDARTRKLEAIANMGRGALATALKLGALLAAIGAALAWAWEHLKP